jgi:D-tyrosyl-tRNA(Tyr) deacylase
MKLFIQRVYERAVTVEGRTVGQIGSGIVYLVGIHRDDKEEDLDAAVTKLLALKLFSGDDGSQFQRTVGDVRGRFFSSHSSHCMQGR